MTFHSSKKKERLSWTTHLVDEAPLDGEHTLVEVVVSQGREETLAEVERAPVALGARVSNDSVHNLVVVLVGDAKETAAVLADGVEVAVLGGVQGDDVVGVGAPPTTVALAHTSRVPGSATGVDTVTRLDLGGGGGRHRGDGGHGKKDSTREEHCNGYGIEEVWKGKSSLEGRALRSALREGLLDLG